MLIDGSTRDVEDSADFVVVGSGAAGATCARWLTAAGKSVIVLEEGLPPKPMKSEGPEALGRLYRDAGAQFSRGSDPMPLLQGRALGGSTVVGAAVQVPLPEEVWQEWVARDRAWAHRLPWDAMERARDRMEAELGVVKVPRNLWGESGGGLLQGLPGRSAPAWRAAPGCHGSGRCLTACPYGVKASVDLALLPHADQQGARIYTRCKAERVLVKDGTATGVIGTFASGHTLKVVAKTAVILAASAIQTPWLLARSGIRGVGVGFQTHPTAVVSGLFHKPVAGLPEATISMQSHAFRADGYELESVVLPRALRAMRVPGVGEALGDRLAQIDHVATWLVSARAEAVGKVSAGWGGAKVEYSPTDRDRRTVLGGVAQAAEAMLRAGALEVWPLVHGRPTVVTTVRQARDLAETEPRPGVVPLAACHFFGGVPVDDRFQVAGTRGLVVADSSLFPSNIGVSPQTTIMAVASLVTERWC